MTVLCLVKRFGGGGRPGVVEQSSIWSDRWCAKTATFTNDSASGLGRVGSTTCTDTQGEVVDWSPSASGLERTCCSPRSRRVRGTIIATDRSRTRRVPMFSLGRLRRAWSVWTRTGMSRCPAKPNLWMRWSDNALPQRGKEGLAVIARRVFWVPRVRGAGRRGDSSRCATSISSSRPSLRGSTLGIRLRCRRSPVGGPDSCPVSIRSSLSAGCGSLP